MKNILLLAALSVCAALPQSQSAIYPGAVATDADLALAVNQVHLRLGAAIGASDTSIQLVSGSNLSSLSVLRTNMMLNIDSEILWVCSVSGGNIQVGRASCPNTDGRGVDGSSAAVHLKNADVYAFLNAAHHNQLAAEVKAIEGALGANLGNINVVRNLGQYDFTPQSPGISLSLGYNTVALTPCPTGVNGSNSNHWLRVSGGVGTAETVLISGGTCTSGAPTGTVVFAAAYTHTGAWTIGSATAGLQEALYAAAGGTVSVPTGTYTVYSHVTIPSNSIIRGTGQGNTVFRMSGYADSAQQYTHCYGLACADAGGLSVFITPAAGASNITLSDFTIDEQSASTSTFSTVVALFNCVDCQIESIGVTNAKATGPPISVLGQNSKHVTVRDSEVIGTGSGPCSGGFFMQGSDILVEGNRVASACDDTFVANAGFSSRITFRSNHSDGTVGFSSFHAEGAPDTVFDNNTCANGGVCFYVSNDAVRAVVRNNKAHNSSYGVSVDGDTNYHPEDVQITDNLIHDMQQMGIALNPSYGMARVLVARNRVWNCGLDGADEWAAFWVRNYGRTDGGTVQTLDTLTVQDNIFYDNGTLTKTNYGIAFFPLGTESPANNVIITGNQIFNTISGGSRVQDFGIRIRCVGCATGTLQQWTIRDNLIRNHPGGTIFYDGYAREQFTNSTFSANDDLGKPSTFRPVFESYATNGSLGLAAINATIPESDGAQIWCTDCQATNPCSLGGSGALAVYSNSAWSCGASTGSVSWISAVSNKPIFDVRSYGLGAENTDATAAIQGAINAACAPGGTLAGGVVELPYGRWNVSATINIPCKLHLRGKGIHSTYLFRTGDYGDTIYTSGIAVHISDMSLLHTVNYAAGPPPTVVNKPTSGAHIHMYDCNTCSVRNVRMENLPYGINLDTSGVVYIEDNQFNSVWDYANASVQIGIAAIYLQRSAVGFGYPTYGYIKRNQIAGPGTAARDVTINGQTLNRIEPAGYKYGIWVSGCEVCDISENSIESMDYSGIYIATRATHAVSDAILQINIHDNYIDYNRLAGVEFDNSAKVLQYALNTKIYNNTILGSGAGMYAVRSNFTDGGYPATWGLDITNNYMYSFIASAISLQSSNKAVITGNQIVEYNYYNTYPTNAISVGTYPADCTGDRVNNAGIYISSLKSDKILATGNYIGGSYLGNPYDGSTIFTVNGIVTCQVSGTTAMKLLTAPNFDGGVQPPASRSVPVAFDPAFQGNTASATSEYLVPNYIATESGANNAIAGALTDASGTAIALQAGLKVSILLAHTLQAGANTFSLNGGTAKNIKSHLNVANNIGTAYAVGSLVTLMYDGTQWQDMAQ